MPFAVEYIGEQQPKKNNKKHLRQPANQPGKPSR